MSIPLSLLDAKGEVPRTLNADSIHLELGHKPVTIRDLRLDSGPKRLVIVLDTSGSMDTGYLMGAAKMHLATTIVGDAITYLPHDISVTLVTFDQKVRQHLDFTASRQQVVSEVRDLQQNAGRLAHGQTALLDALETALDIIPNPAAGDVIYAITDGEDNSSHIRRTQFQRRLQQLGVRLYVCLLYDYLPDGYVTGIDDVTGLASASGGSVLTVPANVRGTVASSGTANFQLTPEQRVALGARLRVMYRLIASPYLLQVTVPARITKPEALKLTLVNGQNKPSQIAYPREVVPCR